MFNKKKSKTLTKLALLVLFLSPVLGVSLYSQTLKNMLDFASEADKKGHRISHIKQQIFSSFKIVANSKLVAQIPVPLTGKTEKGVVYVQSILPGITRKEGVNVFLWRNGVETQLAKNGIAGTEVNQLLELTKGENYIAIVLKDQNSAFARSRVVKVVSPGVKPKCNSIPRLDFAKEAKQNGMIIPPKNVKCFPEFSLISRGDTLVNIPEKLEGDTPDGVVAANIVLPDKLPGGAEVYMWVNGNETLASKRVRKNQRILSKVVLNSGQNYICAIIKKGRSVWGRTPIVKVKSSVRPSISRFELSWNGPGDVDLHLQSVEKNIHINYSRKVHSTGRDELNLDVDNTVAFGPENIRLYKLSEPTKFKCFINYYSGRATLKVTIRQFDRDNRLVKTYTKVVHRKDVSASKVFTNKSKLVTEVTITP